MKTNRLLLIGLLILGLLVLYFTIFDSGTPTTNGSASTNPEAYRRETETARKTKEQFLRTSADSPIPDKSTFKGLSYYRPDLAYQVTARLELFANKTQKLVIKMSDGSEEVYTKYAHAVFSLQGETCRLLIVSTDDSYSVLFRDATSGRETYGGGRYLDLKPENLTGSQVILDFNSAYNPYCAYNPTYACPIPPAENTLPVAVKAGERYIEHP